MKQLRAWHHFILLTILQFLPAYLLATRCMEVIPAAYRMNEYLHFLENKRVGIVGNQTSVIGNTPLLDTLISLGVRVEKIFSPEHGFRGNAADGILIEDGKDTKTGIPIVSLYGDHRKPRQADLKDVDIMIFDIQDVGCRFYTYISTLTLVMEACAEIQLPLIVLDRPNPNGYYIDGPVLESEYASFVGMHPVPVVYGMTIGEYALMVNGEKWLKAPMDCNLRVIPCKKYSHETRYQLPVKPSPNLPDMKSITLYPSLCLFEGTIVSVGRGTEQPFACIGHPGYSKRSYSFVPKSIPGVTEHPPYEGEVCYGLKLVDDAAQVVQQGELQLEWLITFYNDLQSGDSFFTAYFEKLAGTNSLRKQIQEGWTAERIRESWQPGIKKFRKIRNKYLIYPDNQ